MKAIVKINSKSKSFKLQNISEPKLVHKDDVKLKMIYSGICGTDVHIYNSDKWAQNNIKTPHINGHEGIGQVSEIGSAVKKFIVGDYVSFETHIYCNKCHICQLGNYHVCRNMQILGVTRDGVWSEFVVLPEKILFKLDKDISLKYAAILEPFGNAYHTQSYSNLVNKNVLVTGDGPIGIFCALIARTKKPKHLFITGLNLKRQVVAKNCGLHYLNPHQIDLKKEIAFLTQGEGIDIILESSGSETALKQCLDLVNECGEINVISLYKENFLNLNLNAMVFKNIRLQLVTGRKIWSTWNESLALLKSGKISWQMIDEVITHVFPFIDFEKAFQKILNGEACKVLMTFASDQKK